MVARAVRDGRLDRDGLERGARETAGLSLAERGLDQARIDRALDPLESVRVRTLPGGPAPGAVREQLADMSARLDRDRAFVEREQQRVEAAIEGLVAAAREAAR